mgnify:CR=1 FL=1
MAVPKKKTSKSRRNMRRSHHALKAGKRNVTAPLYSHLTYDVLKDEHVVIDQPDILIVEGVNVLQTGPTGSAPEFVSDYFDFSIYVDADEAVIEDYYVQRFLKLCETVFQNPDSFFRNYAHLSRDEAVETARFIWREINGRNLRENIEPTKGRAGLLVQKGADVNALGANETAALHWAAHWDDVAGRWTVTTDQGDTVVCKWLVTGVGCLSSTNMPNIKGRDSFQGDSYHTGAWPHEGVDFRGKRVGIIGTGSSGVQSIPVIAKTAEHLYVFQRTPSSIDERGNRPTDVRLSSNPAIETHRMKAADSPDVRRGVSQPRSSTSGLRNMPPPVPVSCGSAWKRDPGSGVIGVEKGPLIPVV